VLLFIIIPLVGLILAIVALRVIRRMRKAAPPWNVDYSIADLREMLRNGQLTPEEFERAKQVVLRNTEKREAEANRTADRAAGHAFQVIQNPPPLPPPADRVDGGADGGDVDGGKGSRDAR
jgi:hypothetical protein